MPMLAAAASWMAMVNLFNLLPINPLDGGRVFKSVIFSVSNRLGLIYLGVGIVLATFIAFWAGLALFVFLIIVGVIEFAFERQRIKRNEARLAELDEMDKQALNALWTQPQNKAQLLSTIKRIDEEKEKFAVVPKMNSQQIWLAALSYIALVAVLWALMDIMKHVPGADLARQIFLS